MGKEAGRRASCRMEPCDVRGGSLRGGGKRRLASLPKHGKTSAAKKTLGREKKKKSAEGWVETPRRVAGGGETRKTWATRLMRAQKGHALPAGEPSHTGFGGSDTHAHTHTSGGERRRGLPAVSFPSVPSSAGAPAHNSLAGARSRRAERMHARPAASIRRPSSTREIQKWRDPRGRVSISYVLFSLLAPVSSSYC